MKVSLLASAAALVGTALADVSPHDPTHMSLFRRTMGGLERRALADFSGVVNGTFNQLIDHTNPSKGTFKQRYWYNARYWGGPGYPVFMLNGGESTADDVLGFFENNTLLYHYAEQFQGAMIIFEHRYYGASQPFRVMTAETLQYHTVPQSIYDNKYFAETAKLGFDKSGGANAKRSPWVLMGGSYPGALAAWQSVMTPGVFAAHHASSAVVQAIEDFWQYFTPIEKGLPRGCAADIKLVIAKVDAELTRGDKTRIAAMKREFGLESVGDNGDFGHVLSQPIAQWQKDRDEVFKFCNYIETFANNGRVDQSRVNSGVGLTAAWKGYTSYMQGKWKNPCFKRQCDWNYNTDALNPNLLTDERSWQWQLCNEPFGWWQVGPPNSDGTNIVSSHYRPIHQQRTCDLYFPEVRGFKPAISEGFTATQFNDWTKGGWNAPFQNVIFVDGEFDPWKSATMSSDYRPGGPSKSTDNTPRFVIKGGGHVPDFVVGVSREVATVTQKQVQIMEKWLKNWKPKKT
ncbi:extracellular serine carboxypeptidase 1 [Colletotrichum truncatum]|uniref:Extracellular serine carboxypeptidase 1 n=1 Tax=Colletotrichum truncatum TaxID=5467 RepID=A0ACC3ZKQ5_COLTU|nr:extracellular serine carboxypeptidase 1 [Colletotrichum truncatum]KAF6799859.1 extracellular serine carboxypeptidase 1 [Colletotrichum truncatum]